MLELRPRFSSFSINDLEMTGIFKFHLRDLPTSKHFILVCEYFLVGEEVAKFSGERVRARECERECVGVRVIERDGQQKLLIWRLIYGVKSSS